MSPPLIGLLGVIALFALLLLRLRCGLRLRWLDHRQPGDLRLDQRISTLGQTPFDTRLALSLCRRAALHPDRRRRLRTGLSADLFKAASVMMSTCVAGLRWRRSAASACFGAVCARPSRRQQQ